MYLDDSDGMKKCHVNIVKNYHNTNSYSRVRGVNTIQLLGNYAFSVSYHRANLQLATITNPSFYGQQHNRTTGVDNRLLCIYKPDSFCKS